MNAPSGRWPVGVVGAAYVSAAAALGLAIHPAVPTYSYVSEAACVAVFLSALGALLVFRGVAGRLGLLLLGMGLAGGMQALSAQVALASAGWPGSAALSYASVVLRHLAFGSLFLFLLWFPTGRAPGRRWEVVGPLTLAGWVLIALASVLTPGPLEDIPDVFAAARFPGSATVAAVAALIGNPLALGGWLLALLSLVVRFRRSSTVERQQIKVFVFAVVGWTALLVVLNVVFPVQMEGPLGSLVWGAPAWLFPAVVVWVAILRHGLYDIDRIVSRAVSYAGITAVVLGVYAGLVLALGGLLKPVTGGDDLAVAASTLAAAAAFRPVQRRVQRVVDRRFNRAGYDAQRTIEGFSVRLRDEIDIDTLAGDLSRVVATTMHPERVSIWTPGAPRR